MQSSFQDVNSLLSTDEEVLYEFKPNSKRYLFIGQLLGILLGIAFGSIFFVIGLLGLIGVIIADDGSRFGFIIMMIVGLVPVLSPIIRFFTSFKRYKNTMYIVTNNRLIIRSGFIGVDYKEMSLHSVSSMDVRVDFFDKLVHPNTGTISFANAANPMYGPQNGRANVSNFRFDYIENPYEVYKKIKEVLPQ